MQLLELQAQGVKGCSPAVRVALKPGYLVLKPPGPMPPFAALLAAPLASRRFCGKNVCHGVLLTPERAARMAQPRHAAGEVYLMAVRLYLEKHGQKKMHDPTALACHLYPEIGTWFRGRPTRNAEGWTTVPDPVGDHILADVNHERLWECLLGRT